MQKKEECKKKKMKEEEKKINILCIIDLHYRVINAQHPYLILDDLIAVFRIHSITPHVVFRSPDCIKR